MKLRWNGSRRVLPHPPTFPPPFVPLFFPPLPSSSIPFPPLSVWSFIYNCSRGQVRDCCPRVQDWRLIFLEGAVKFTALKFQAPSQSLGTTLSVIMTSIPRGCYNISSTYYNLCDMDTPWGIVLETLAAAGIVTSIVFMLSPLILICKVQDSCRRKVLPTQFIFLLGVFGLFGLTFAFIIKLNKTTGPTRFFLFGVLFALCFSCLLAHTFMLAKLVRGKKPLSMLMILGLALGFSLVQDIIAVEYVVITMGRTNTHVFEEMPRKQRNEDFVMLLIYVLFLISFTFIMSISTFCGSFSGWKRHGAHIYMTMLFSIGIWVAWITLLLNDSFDPSWDDTILSTALVANGWVFLLMYIFPEFILLTKQRNPRDYPVEENFCKPQFMKQSYGMENRAYLQEEITQGPESPGSTLYAPYSTHFQLQNQDSQKDFSIPRPKTRSSPYDDYGGRKAGN
uniref:G protein-coupled receptor class C group 5 member A n=2 Tax=Monodelphis domestica TaxID=13616 RepID=F6PGM6_MONDO